MIDTAIILVYLIIFLVGYNQRYNIIDVSKIRKKNKNTTIESIRNALGHKKRNEDNDFSSIIKRIINKNNAYGNIECDPESKAILNQQKEDRNRTKTNIYMTADEKTMYLKSRRWNTIKQKVFDRDNKACVTCSSTKHLNCHHITYERLGAEDINDLVTLCSSCHSSIHNKLGYDRLTIYTPKRKC